MLMLEVKNDSDKRTIYVRITGTPSTHEMRHWALDDKLATDSYRGRPHLIVADMRGLGGLGPEAAAVLGQAIDYGRKRGVRRCAHLSDSSIVRLQTRRLAREASRHDQITIDVISVGEAERVMEEDRQHLFAGPVAVKGVAAR